MRKNEVPDDAYPGPLRDIVVLVFMLFMLYASILLVMGGVFWAVLPPAAFFSFGDSITAMAIPAFLAWWAIVDIAKAW